MITTPLRWQRVSAATAVGCALLLSSCSGTGASTTDGTPTKQPPSSPAAPTPDAAALAAQAKAVALTRQVRAYAFTAVQTLKGPTVQRTVLTGRAIRPSSITYNLLVGTSRQQVIKIGATTFVRLPPAGWKAIAKPTPTADPLASLLPLLAGLRNPSLIGAVLSGTVTAATLSEAKLAPGGSQSGADAPVRFTLDPRGRVASVTVILKVNAGNQILMLEGSTRFSSFDKVAVITPPGVVKR